MPNAEKRRVEGAYIAKCGVADLSKRSITRKCRLKKEKVFVHSEVHA